MIILAGVLMGLASILKYHVLSLLIFLFALQYFRARHLRQWAIPVYVTGIATVLLGVYLVQMHSTFGFWVTPERFQNTHRLSLSGSISNFVTYAGYLVMLSAPLSLVFPGIQRICRQYWKTIIFSTIILFSAGVYGLQDNGEMNLGPLDRWIPQAFILGVFSLLAVCCIISLFPRSKDGGVGSQTEIALKYTVLTILLVFSLSRPAQRYLLILLPLYVLSVSRYLIYQKRLVLLAIICFLALDGFIAYSQWCTGTAANKMVQAVHNMSLLSVTDPGSIDSHVGNQFPLSKRASAQYIVQSGILPGAVLTTSSAYSFAQKSYSLIPIQRN